MFGLVVIALLIWRTDQYSAFLYRGGILLLSVATVLVVAALVHPASWLGPALGWTPLRWLGVRSYGIYLWHWPIIVLTTPTAQRGINLSLAALQVGATIAVAALSWRFVEEPIRRGALGRFWAQVRSREWRREADPRQFFVPRRVYRRRRRQRGAARVVSVVALSVLALDVAGLSGVIGTGTDGSGSPQPSAKAPAEKISTYDAAVAPRTTTPAPATSSPRVSTHDAATPSQPSTDPAPETSSPGDASATHTSCQAVAYIGDSTSAGMVMPSYLPDPSRRLNAQFARVGATSQHIEISPARSIVETLSGQANAEQVARRLITQGFRGCWVLALGTNDTANIYAGSQVGRMARIEQMMSVVGNQPVLWVNPKSLLESGPYAEANMKRWDRALVQACARYPNMRVFDWASVANNGWFISDGTHYTSEGYAQRARLTAASLVHAFPTSGKGEGPSCVVH